MTPSRPTARRIAAALPERAGVGLKPDHYRDILAEHARGSGGTVGFFEVHAENYMGAGGPPHRYLEAIRRDYPLSLHGVGLSIGAPRPLDRDHLQRLKGLIERYEPGLFSEHLAWSTHDSGFLNDLLPLPYTEATLDRVVRHVSEVQETLQRRMLLENPSTYLTFADSTIGEIDFLTEVARRSGCGLLLDVANVFVSATNHGYDPYDYIDAFPIDLVDEIHLAGHDATTDDAGLPLLIDSHNAPTPDAVFALYRHTLKRRGPVPTLVEWDADLPDWPVLRAEAERVEQALAAERARRNRIRKGAWHAA